MADNVTIPATGTGSATPVVATDNVAGVHYQKVKLDLGGDGASDPAIGTVPVSGTVTVTEPVSVDDNGGSLTVDGTVTANAGTGPYPIGTAYVEGVDSPTALNTGDPAPAYFDEYGRLKVDIARVSYGAVDIAHSGLTGLDGAISGGLVQVAVVTPPAASVATLSNVSGSASSVTLKASNSTRKGLSIHNDSSAILYVKFGTTASTTSFTVKMAADAHYEVPFGYTGRIDGIWDSATGAARITELT